MKKIIVTERYPSGHLKSIEVRINVLGWLIAIACIVVLLKAVF